MKLVTSRDNPLVKTLKRLGQSAKARRDEGLTVLDSIHLVAAYEAAGLAVQALIVSESGLAQAEVAAFVADREVVVLPDALYRDCAVVEHPAGLMALVPVPPAPEIDPGLDSVLLDGVQDPGNVGTLIRTAAAAGFRQILLSPRLRRRLVAQGAAGRAGWPFRGPHLRRRGLGGFRRRLSWDHGRHLPGRRHFPLCRPLGYARGLDLRV